MTSAELLSIARQRSFWLGIGCRQDELRTWQGGITADFDSIERWEQVVIPHMREVQAALPDSDQTPGRKKAISA